MVCYLVTIRDLRGHWKQIWTTAFLRHYKKRQQDGFAICQMFIWMKVQTRYRRCAILINGLAQLGWNIPGAQIYVSLDTLPEWSMGSAVFRSFGVQQTGPSDNSWKYFGVAGEGYVRIGLIAEVCDRLQSLHRSKKANIQIMAGILSPCSSNFSLIDLPTLTSVIASFKYEQYDYSSFR